MYLTDLASCLLGGKTASILRVTALFRDGITPPDVNDVVDGDLGETHTIIDQMVGAGVLLYLDDGRVVVNVTSPYWVGVVELLDLRLNLIRLIGALAEDLAGPSTRVALYGAPATDGALYDPVQSTVFIRPATVPLDRLSLIDEAVALIPPHKGEATFVASEKRDPLQQVLASGSTALLRSWLRGEDIHPELDHGELVSVSREVPISELRRIRPEPTADPIK